MWGAWLLYLPGYAYEVSVSLGFIFYVWWYLFYRRYSGGNRSAGAIVPSVEGSVSWHDAIIPGKRSLCQENAVLLVV